MINRAQPMGLRQRETLIVRNRYERGVREMTNNARQTWKIKAPMTGRQVRDADAVQQRELHPVYMAMQHIELGRMLSHKFQQHGLRRHWIGARAAQVEAPVATPRLNLRAF